MDNLRPAQGPARPPAQEPARGPWHYLPYVPVPAPQGWRLAGQAVGGLAAGLVTRLAPSSDTYEQVDPARAPGPAAPEGPPIPALTPKPTQPGNIIPGLPPPSDDHVHDWWLVPAIIVVVLVTMGGLLKLATTQIRRYQPRPAGTD